MRLQRKNVLITGAASGIGRQMALAFAAEGACVGVADIDVKGAEHVARHLREQGRDAISIAMDVTQEDQVSAGVDAFVERAGGLDTAVANAGIQVLGALADVPFSEWKRLLAVHLDGSFLLAQAALRHMVPARRGNLLFLGSIHSYMVSPDKGPYAVAKHGIVALCRAVAREHGGHGIVANTICPGFVRTPLIERQLPLLASQRGVSESQVLQDFMRLAVDGRCTTVEELAELAVVLSAFPSGLLNGQSIGASHGIHML
jgi:3-hydroxybutyrate dehydrogenase